MGSGNHFRVTLSVKKEPDAGPVYCKMETSKKFRQLKTVKLSCNTCYRFDISFKPPQLLQTLNITGEPVNLIEQFRDGTACAYSAYHCTKAAHPSPKGHREELQIGMLVLGSGYLTTSLQIKYYKPEDHGHCDWGSKLHCIELDCSSDKGRLVTVDKETYRKLGIES